MKKIVAAGLLTFGFIIFFALLSPKTVSNDKTANMARAKDLFVQQCSKCHRNNGSGIKRIYPPLKNADYIKNNTSEELLRGMLFGRSGKITVNGVSYNGVMTTEIDGSLSDDDIALILTYVYRELNGIDKTINAKDVQQARKKGKLPEHK